MGTQDKGRIQSRPNSGRNLGSTTTGLRRTGLETDRDGLLYVPDSFRPDRQSPLIITLHGAGGTAEQGLLPFQDLSDHTGTILLAPESQGPTWDLIQGGFGLDSHFIDEALSDLFSLYPIDPEHLAIAGFSDGATYALSLGITNGDLFSHIIAFSPGHSTPAELRDSPPIFISHGKSDEILPIDSCSRKLMPRLKDAGLDVTYYEFDGGHTIPEDIGRKAFVWFLGTEAIPKIQGATVQSSEAGIEFT
jgi:phospholipase/carboxylesterase